MACWDSKNCWIVLINWREHVCSLFTSYSIFLCCSPKKKKNALTVHQGLYLFLLHLEFVPCFIWCNRTIPLNVYWYFLLNQTGILSQSKLVKSHQHWNVSSTWTVPHTLSLVIQGQVSSRKGISEWQQSFSGGLFTFPQHSDTFLPFSTSFSFSSPPFPSLPIS